MTLFFLQAGLPASVTKPMEINTALPINRGDIKQHSQDLHSTLEKAAASMVSMCSARFCHMQQSYIKLWQYVQNNPNLQ